MNLRYLLLMHSEWFEERVVQEAMAHGYGFVTPAMNRIFAHMRHQPVSISELARQLAISRQAVHQTVAEAQRRGIVKLTDDPTDRRLKMVRFTEQGMEMSRTAARAIHEIEVEIERQLGAKDLATLKRILSKEWGPRKQD